MGGRKKAFIISIMLIFLFVIPNMVMAEQIKSQSKKLSGQVFIDINNDPNSLGINAVANLRSADGTSGVCDYGWSITGAF